MGKTAKYGLPYPEETDVANVPRDLKNLAEKTEEAMGNVDIKILADLFYPVGRGFLDFTDTDYSNWLGLKWERELVGMTPVGKNVLDTDFNEIGKQGGEKTHQLTINEMPVHTHTQNAHTHTQNAHNHAGMYWHGIQGTLDSGSVSGKFVFNHTWTNTADTGNNLTTGSTTATNQSTTATNQNTGGGHAHNILQPYQVVSYWKRVDDNAKKIITFMIDNSNTVYEAEEGMTWAEWCNSVYNTGGWYVKNQNSIWSDPWHLDAENLANIAIVEGTKYDAIQEK